MQAEKRDYYIYNTMSRTKELFRPVVPGMVGLYVCGPTVYGDAHLGHARPAITFDVLTRYFRYMGYKVRYVRNITDVGHLEHDSDEGEDKIAKRAKMEQLEPMEVAQECTIKFHKAMERLNTLPPSIEPHASGHIIEQIQLIQQILEHGFAYVSNGSVYFDVAAYNKKYHYGVLSGRNLEDILTNTRELDGAGDKHSSVDFALWKKASPEHIMRWPSPWSNGFPGWHLECSAMSAKYLGEEFDIHGGGMDLLFPHHECELAQNCASRGKGGIHYWMHNNMITINGQKMGKSLGNFITLDELFNGTHKLLAQPYSPMTVRFFILQAHYRSTLDFSNEALQAAEKGLKRIMQAAKDVEKLEVTDSKKLPNNRSNITDELVQLKERLFEALSDDLNTPIALSHLFDAVRIVNSVKDGSIAITDSDKGILSILLGDVVESILGLKNESAGEQNKNSVVIEKLMEIVLAERMQAKANKDWAKSDKIRDELTDAGVKIKDTKNGVEWFIE